MIFKLIEKFITQLGISKSKINIKAEKYLYNEFSIVLDMNYEETSNILLTGLLPETKAEALERNDKKKMEKTIQTTLQLVSTMKSCCLP